MFCLITGKQSLLNNHTIVMKSYRFKKYILGSVNGNGVIIIRLIVGLIFLSEGIQKFLFPESIGAGRFEKIGFSNPEFWAAFTGVFEIVCGLLVLSGFLARLAAIPLLIVMITAFITTKLPILTGKGFWPFAHEYRTDFAMTLLLIYLLLYNDRRRAFGNLRRIR
jgi:uncharacterized membrane protein YphA (DoxX/SURF4 family)